MSLDPAALQVLIARLTGIAAEMGAVLQRGAFSPNIKERADHSTALFTPEGEMLAQAEHIPVHLGSMPASVGAAIERFGPGTDGWSTLGPGDQIVVNDPFAGGTHLNDITVVAPCREGRPPRRVGRQPGPPRRRRRVGSGLDARRRVRDLRRGAPDPAGPAHPRGAGAAAGQLAHARRASGRPRRPGRGQPPGQRTAGGAGRRAVRRGARPRRTADARRPRRPARRSLGVRRRRRQLRPRAPPAGRHPHPSRPGDRRRHHRVRPLAQRRPACRQRQRRRGRHRQRRGVRPALRPRPDAAGQRGRAAAGRGAHPTGVDRRRDCRRRRSAPATSRSASASPTSASARWRSCDPAPSVRRRRAR